MSKKILIDNKYLRFDKINKDIIYIDSKGAKHIYALRYKVGDKICINDYMVRIEKFSKEYITANILEEIKLTKNDITISLYMGYLKSDKMDFCIQKAVELGVNNIFPMLTKNTVVKLDLKDRASKKERFAKIISSGVEQSGRDQDVRVYNIEEMKNLYDTFKDYDMVFLAYEKSSDSLKEKINTFKQNSYKKIAIILGPEGGFDASEVKDLKEKVKHLTTVSLGKNILRAETAMVGMLAIINYELVM